MDGCAGRSRGPSAHVRARVVASTRARSRRTRASIDIVLARVSARRMARERRETSPSATGGAIDGTNFRAFPCARGEIPRKSAREANRGAVQRYRDRQRARAGALERECARLRETNARLEGELAHARWVLEEVRDDTRSRRAFGRDRWVGGWMADVHDRARERVSVGGEGDGAGGPFGSVANAFANANGRGRGRGERGRRREGGEDGAMKGKRRKRRRGGRCR